MKMCDLKVGDMYECWINGKLFFCFNNKFNLHKNLFDTMLRDCLGTKGSGSVDLILEIHHKSLLEYYVFLDKIGEE